MRHVRQPLSGFAGSMLMTAKLCQLHLPVCKYSTLHRFEEHIITEESAFGGVRCVVRHDEPQQYVVLLDELSLVLVTADDIFWQIRFQSMSRYLASLHYRQGLQDRQGKHDFRPSDNSGRSLK